MVSLPRIVRFVVAGGGSLGLDLTFQWGFLSLLLLPIWLASALSYELALVAHFFVANRWVFGQRRSSWRRLAQFQVTALTAAAITLGVTWALVYGPAAALFSHGIGPYAAKFLGTTMAFCWTFASSFFWIWRARPAETAGAVEVVTPISSHLMEMEGTT